VRSLLALGPPTPFQIVLALLAGGAGVPLPEDLVLVAAGWRVGRGDASFLKLAPLALAAIVASDLFLYGLGRLARTHPRIARWLERPSVARLEGAYRRHGVKLVALARIAMGARAPFFLAAGMVRMPLGRFLIVDTLGAAVMTCAWMRVGAWLGPRLGELTPHLHAIAIAALVAVLIVIAWKARRLAVETRSEPRSAPPSSTSARRRVRAAGSVDPPPARPPA
jgi:membrane protein DedA with SNARE-associated domain